MPKNNPQWRHHYVPEFYLKRWRLGGDRLVEYGRPYGQEVKYQWVSPKETGYVDKLYYLEHLPEELKNAYEQQFFTPVDTRAASVLAKMEAGNFNLNAKERSSWARFMMSLVFRNPETIEAVKQRLMHEVFEPSKADEREYRKRRRPNEPRTLREALSGERDQNYINRIALQLTTGMADNRRIGGHLINMRWGYRRLSFQVPALLTSDRPIVWALGLGKPDSHILLPIGPKAVFWMAQSPSMLSRLQNITDVELVDFMNEHVTRRAVKFVWGASKHRLEYVREFMGKEPPDTVPDMLIRQQWDAVRHGK